MLRLIKKHKAGEPYYLTSSLRWQILRRDKGWVVEPSLRLGDQEAAFSGRRLERAGLAGRSFPLRADAVAALEAMLAAEKRPQGGALREFF